MEGTKLVLGLLGAVAVAGYVAKGRSSTWSEPGSYNRSRGRGSRYWMGSSMVDPTRRVLDCESRQVLEGQPSRDLVERASKRGPDGAIAARNHGGVWFYEEEDGLDPFKAMEDGVIAVCIE